MKFPLRNTKDSIPAMLAPGEVILNNKQQAGVKVTDPSALRPEQVARLKMMQGFARGGMARYARGGIAPISVSAMPSFKFPKARSVDADLAAQYAHEHTLAKPFPIARNPGMIPQPKGVQNFGDGGVALYGPMQRPMVPFAPDYNPTRQEQDAATRDQPFYPKTDADFDVIPIGGRFIDPQDGMGYIKRSERGVPRPKSTPTPGGILT